MSFSSGLEISMFYVKLGWFDQDYFQLINLSLRDGLRLVPSA